MVKLKIFSMVFIVKFNSECFIWYYKNRENRVGNYIFINSKFRVECVIVKGVCIIGVYCS